MDSVEAERKKIVDYLRRRALEIDVTRYGGTLAGLISVALRNEAAFIERGDHN